MEPLEYRPRKSPFKLIPMPGASDPKPLNDDTSATVKASSPEPKCSRCNGQRIVTGSISDSHRGRCIFAPARLKFWTITKSYGTKLENWACLDCGLVWMQTPPRMLEDFVRNYCEQKID